MNDAMPRYDTAAGRRDAILSRLQASGFLSISDLAADLQVSDMTVRRDLRLLERDGLVRVVRGGVSLPVGSQVPAFSGRADAHHDAKVRIGARAAELVGSADAIAIDAGTTPCELAAALPQPFTGSVVTHSVPVLQQMLGRPPTRVVGLGGDLNPESRAFVGPMTVEGVARLRVRLFFLGAAAVDERGIYVSTDLERPTKQALMGIADEVVLMVDHSKVEASAPVLLCPLDAVGTVVTDRQPAAGLAAALAAAGVRVCVAEGVPAPSGASD
ncbi:DeoR/GlpR transcriptional regulator [Streptomyces armeniacus]|uniref:Lactose phosphotransferase system repressor n=1 Tax=Streptomyces armeniacus TaxID=83291 RepID=A0A345XPE3_9ACTN|nr:DeoR/GlpR family DNA-binding transcription regulator [Streptomyces armeniacus]AXK33509.1 DeoR/GlpR transcriptional regulator [Streptomyces armeniacus]